MSATATESAILNHRRLEDADYILVNGASPHPLAPVRIYAARMEFNRAGLRTLYMPPCTCPAQGIGPEWVEVPGTASGLPHLRSCPRVQALLPTFYVVRVNGDDLDTHAAKTLEEALERAAPDDDARIDFTTVQATDAGAARLMQPETWQRYACATCGPQDKAAQGYDGADYHVGDRVELHPALDRWMMGDRYGDVDHLLKDGRVQVKTDKGATLKAFPHQFRAICLAALLFFLSWPAFAAPPCKVNVNTASPEQMQLLARTGPVLALRLASGRPYRHLEAVDAVKGVGPSWLSVNGPHVAFTGPTTCTAKVAAPTVPRVAAQAPKL